MNCSFAWAWFDNFYNWLFIDATPTADKIAFCSMFVSLAGGLFAAYLGAKYGAKAAVRLAHEQQVNDTKDKQCSYLIAAQYALSAQWNLIEGVRLRILEPLRDDPFRHLKLPRYYAPDTAMHIRAEEIAFLAEQGNAPLLMDIDIAQQRYLICLEAITRLREEIIAMNNNPKIDREGFDFQTGVSKIKATERDLFFVKEAANVLYRVIDGTLPHIVSIIPKIEEHIESVFKKKGIKMITKPPLAEAKTNKPDGSSQRTGTPDPGEFP